MIGGSNASVPPAFDAVTTFAIGSLAILVAMAWVWTWTPNRPRTRVALGLGTAAVMLASALAARTGVLQRFDIAPPPMAMMIAAIFSTAFALGLSQFGRGVADDVPLRTLIGLQSFRLPLELVMHRAATLGIMPAELSYSGYNFDIVTGLGALVIWLLLRASVRVPRWVLWGWNAWGCWCLAVIALIAITTSPMLRLFGNDPRHLNTWVLFFPYVWLPTVLVTIAVTAHIVITRRLLSHAQQPQASTRVQSRR